MAALIDVVQISNWQFAAANTPKGKPRPDRPKPVERPGQAKRRTNRTQLSDREIARRLVALQRKQRKG